LRKRADSPRGSVLAIKNPPPVNSARSLRLCTLTARRITLHYISSLVVWCVACARLTEVSSRLDYCNAILAGLSKSCLPLLVLYIAARLAPSTATFVKPLLKTHSCKNGDSVKSCGVLQSGWDNQSLHACSFSKVFWLTNLGCPTFQASDRRRPSLCTAGPLAWNSL